jgi:hypothetical protein
MKNKKTEQRKSEVEGEGGNIFYPSLTFSL